MASDALAANLAPSMPAPATRSASRPERAIYRPFGAFRFVLSMMVVCQHAAYLLPMADRPFFWMMGFGIIAVMLFFIISGFVIAEANATFYVGRPVAFMVNRTLRLVPPYIAALALAAIVQQWLYLHGRLHLWDGDLIGSPLQIKVLIAGLLDIVPFFHPGLIGAQDVHFIPFAWSLRLEFTFYLYVFLTFVVMAWLPRRPARCSPMRCSRCIWPAAPSRRTSLIRSRSSCSAWRCSCCGGSGRR
jgi:peptidoglycan/LPS O-acetylase OafA/YrhL